MIIKTTHREKIFLLRSGKVEKKERESAVEIELPDIKFPESLSEGRNLQKEPLTSLSFGPPEEEAFREMNLAIKNYIPLRLKVSLHVFRSETVKIRFWTTTFLNPSGLGEIASERRSVRTFKSYPAAFPILRTGSSLFLTNLLNSEVVKMSSTPLLDIKDRTETLLEGDTVFAMLEEVVKHENLLSSRSFPWALNLKARTIFPANQKNISLLRNGYPNLKKNFPHTKEGTFTSLEQLQRFFSKVSIKSGFYFEARSGTSRRKPELSVKGLRNLRTSREGFVAEFLWSSYEGINSGPIKLFIPYEEFKLAGITQKSDYFYDEENLRFFKIPSFVVRAYGVKK